MDAGTLPVSFPVPEQGGRRTGHRACLLLAALLSLSSIPSAACPFCEAPSTTYSEQLGSAQAAALLAWVSTQPPDRETGLGGTTHYRLLQIARDESESLVRNQALTLNQHQTGAAGELFLVFGNQLDGKYSWGLAQPVTQACWDYLVGAPARSAPPRQRLAYYLRYLEHPEPDVAIDAFGEFANARYEDLLLVVDLLPRERLRDWLSNPEVTPTRRGLYGMMLGLCGTGEDAEFLKDQILPASTEPRLGTDGMMAGYLLLTGPLGLDVLVATKLKPSDAAIGEAFAAIQALRFMWTYGQHRIPPERLCQAMWTLLDHSQLADQAVIDLARWQDWTVMDRLLTRYGQGNYADRHVKQAIVRYLLVAERDVPADPEATLPAHVVQARKYLEELRMSDPATVRYVERHFFD